MLSIPNEGCKLVTARHNTIVDFILLLAGAVRLGYWEHRGRQRAVQGAPYLTRGYCSPHHSPQGNTSINASRTSLVVFDVLSFDSADSKYCTRFFLVNLSK